MDEKQVEKGIPWDNPKIRRSVPIMPADWAELKELATTECETVGIYCGRVLRRHLADMRKVQLAESELLRTKAEERREYVRTLGPQLDIQRSALEGMIMARFGCSLATASGTVRELVAMHEYEQDADRVVRKHEPK